MDSNREYRTYQIRISKKHSLFEYCEAMCFNSKNLYNIGKFYIRQAYSGLKKTESDRHENESMVINNINNSIAKLNEICIETFEKRKHYKSKKSSVKVRTAPSLFKELTAARLEELF